MDFSVQKVNEVTLFEINGDMWGNPDMFKIIDETKAQLEKGERKFLVDLKKTKRLDSTGVGILIHMLTSVKNAEGELRLCEVTGKTKAALSVTGVWQIFEIHGTREEALRSYTGF